MYMHVQGFSEGSEKAGNELQTTITSDVIRNSVLGKDMGNEVLRELFRGAGNMSRNENALFGESVNNNQKGVKTVRKQKWRNEVYENGIPRMWENRKLLESAVGFVELQL